jgi:zinc resistance-associated protein
MGVEVAHDDGREAPHVRHALEDEVGALDAGSLTALVEVGVEHGEAVARAAVDEDGRWLAAAAAASLAAVLVLAVAVAGALFAAGAHAQFADRMRGGMDPGPAGMPEGFSAEDVSAFTDARIAALRAGLKLSPDQDKLWPPVEDAIRGLVRQRRDQMRAWRESRGQIRDDIPGLLRGMADRQAARADALRKLADAAAPLYASLDESQKRRLLVLARAMRPRFGATRHAMGGMMDRRPAMDES